MLRHSHVMSSLRAFGLCIPLRAFRAPLRSRVPPSSRIQPYHCLSQPTRELPRQLYRGAPFRAATTAAQKARTPAYRYPEVLNIYRHGAIATSFVGVTRLATLFLLVLGTFVEFPNYTYSYFFPSEYKSSKEKPVKWYIPPLILFGSWLPATLAFFAMAPWVHQIHVRLPLVARRSRDELMRWASNVPRNTVVSISMIRLKPWPTVQNAAWEDLSRLPFSYTRLTNLEMKPPDHKRYLEQKKGSWWARLKEGMARRVLGRFYVNRSQGRDRSAAPGVWDKMWEQIPMEGTRKERRVVLEQRRAEAKPPGPRVSPPKART